MKLATSILVLVIAGVVRPGLGAEGGRLDWRAWERLPVFDNGRVMPLDTFAGVLVKKTCGPGRLPLDLSAPELLFAWLAEPEKWEQTAFLLADDPKLRTEILELPLQDENAQPLRYVSPRQIAAAARFYERLEQLRKWESREVSGIDEQVLELERRYTLYRQLTFQPAAPASGRSRFLFKLGSAFQKWQELERDLLGRRAADDRAGVAALAGSGDAIRQVAETMASMVTLHRQHEEVALGELQPLAATLQSATAALAARAAQNQKAQRNFTRANCLLRQSLDDLAQLAAEARMALYDNGGTTEEQHGSLRVVPALDASALEADRYRRDVHPWLGLQAVLYAPEELLASYPRGDLRHAREAFAEAVAAYRDRDNPGQPQRLTTAMQRFTADLRGLGEGVEPLRRKLDVREREESIITATEYPPPHSTALEVLYNHLDPFFWAWAISLAALACLVLSFLPRLRAWMFWPGIGLLAIGQAVVLVGFVLRGCISGWVPVTNMFETIVFVGLCGAMLGTVLTLLPPRGIYARRPVTVAGAAVAVLALSAACFVPKFHKEIQPITAVLRSNFWLAIHVKTIVAGYGTAAMAWVLGNIALGHYLFGRYGRSDLPSGSADVPDDTRSRSASGTYVPAACATLGDVIYKLIQVTVLLLAIGTILGGMWADYSWGRFWGWDPKEVWALISLLVYMIILHARHMGWSGHFNMVLGAVLGAVTILWTWYGVNFLMSGGKHSYGEGAGGKWAVIGIILANCVFLAAAGVRYLAETSQRTTP